MIAGWSGATGDQAHPIGVNFIRPVSDASGDLRRRQRSEPPGTIELISSTTAIHRVASRPLGCRFAVNSSPSEFTEVSHDGFI
jgi:hypothetical protein